MMKKICFTAGLAAICAVIGLSCFYAASRKSEHQRVLAQWREEQEKAQLLEKRVEEISGELTDSEKNNQTLKDQIKDLTNQIDELLTEEVAAFDAGMIREEINDIGELATVEYNYTNVGTLDSSKKFELIGVKVPFSSKTAVVTMDGIMKIGVDVKGVEVSCNENSKIITVKVPKAEILSNELDEGSLTVYTEENGIFNDLTLEDGSTIRNEIKRKAAENAEKNDLLNKSEEKVKQMIKGLIEAVPSVKDTYKIEFTN